MINSVMLFVIYLERRPIQLSEKEQTIYDLTFRSLEPRVFKKLIDVTLSAVEVINLKKLQIIIYFVFIMTRITTLR